MHTTLRAALVVAAITIVWLLVLGYGVLYLVFGDCFELGCRAVRDDQASGLFSLVGIGYLLSLIVYFRARVRRVKGD